MRQKWVCAANVVWVENCDNTRLSGNRASNLSGSAALLGTGANNTNLRNDPP